MQSPYDPCKKVNEIRLDRSSRQMQKFIYAAGQVFTNFMNVADGKGFSEIEIIHAKLAEECLNELKEAASTLAKIQEGWKSPNEQPRINYEYGEWAVAVRGQMESFMEYAGQVDDYGQYRIAPMLDDLRGLTDQFMNDSDLSKKMKPRDFKMNPKIWTVYPLPSAGKGKSR